MKINIILIVFTILFSAKNDIALLSSAQRFALSKIFNVGLLIVVGPTSLPYNCPKHLTSFDVRKNVTFLYQTSINVTKNSIIMSVELSLFPYNDQQVDLYFICFQIGREGGEKVYLSKQQTLSNTFFPFCFPLHLISEIILFRML